MTRPAALAIAAVSFLLLPGVAHGAGPMVGGLSTSGVAVGKVRYLATPAGRGTLLERVAVHGGQPLGYRYLREQLGIPMVTLDGAGGGLSHDGRTLVLSQPRTRYPQRTSRLYVMNAHGLSRIRTLTLKGDFSYDAMSPDGATIYLIQLNPRDPTRYAVRALDAASGRLVPRPVVDPRKPDEAMRGFPATRTTSPDGRFVYTLYNGGEKPFVHALDTTRGVAACIDVPGVANDAATSLRLDGRRLTVLDGGAPVSYVDTVTRRVTPALQAGPPRTGAAQQRTAGHGGAPPLWALLAGAAAAALGAAAAVGARRRRAGAVRS